MNNQQAYDEWAASYNDIVNLTRDTELIAKQAFLKNIPFTHLLELGCGTGKNTEWLSLTANKITAVDFSEQMLAVAKSREYHNDVNFVVADINEPWQFVHQPFDLITCSLVLEHIQFILPVFKKAAKALQPGGFFYIGELHPFKQYSGSKARFQKDDETIILDCFLHPISAYITNALDNHFSLIQIKEWTDEDTDQKIPRILSLLFQKK